MIDGIFTNASFKSNNVLHLWLGAGIMVEYPFNEAKEALEDSLKNCIKNIELLKKETEYIKDNITTIEVEYIINVLIFKYFLCD